MKWKNEIIFFALGSFFGSSGAVFLVWRHFQKLSEAKIQAVLAEISENLKKSDENEGISEPNGELSSDGKTTNIVEGKDEKTATNSYGNLDGESASYSEFYNGITKAADTVYFHENYDPAEAAYPSEDDEDEVGYLDMTDEEFEEREMMIREGNLVTKEMENQAFLDEFNADLISNKKPKLITSESYDNEYDHFDRIQLEYYTVDDILVEVEGEEEIYDVEQVVGDCLDKYGFRTNDEERVIFVRNFRLGAQYEITKVFTSFYDRDGKM